MTRRYYPPAFLRYLKARLWNLARPSFWVTAIFLSVLGLVIKEYWTHPDFLTQREQRPVASQQPADSSLSKEDKALAADIDNLPALYNSPAQASLQPLAETPEQNSNNKTLLKDLSSKSQEAKSTSSSDTANSSSTPKIENPFLIQAENLLQGKNLQTESKSLGANSPTTSSVVLYGSTATSFGSSVGVGAVNQTNYSQKVTSVNPQTTQNQPINQYPPALNGTTTSTQPDPLVGQPLPINNSTRQIIPSTTGLGTDTSNPTTLSSYTQPQVTNQPQNPYSIVNPYPYSSAQSRYNLNRFVNRYSNFTSNQTSPSVVPSTTLVSPSTSTPSTYTTPYYTQTPGQGLVTPYNSVTTNNYGTNSWQQSGRINQYNLYSPRQNAGQYSNGGVTNNYSYP